MAGQGSPQRRAGRCAGSRWLPLLIALALCQAGSARAADIDARLRLAWGGGEARSWQGTIQLSEGELSEIVPLGWEPDSPGSLQPAGPTSVRIYPRSPRTYDGCDLRVQAPDSAKLLVQIWSDGAPAGPPVEVPLAKVIRSFSQFDLDDRHNRLFAQRAPGDVLRVAFERSSLIFAPSEQFDFEVQPNVPDLAPGTTYLLAASLERARIDEQVWNKDFEIRVDSSGNAAAVPIGVPLPADEGVYDIKLHVYPKRLTSSLLRGKPLATRKVQLVVLAPVKLLDRQPAAWQSVLEFDPASPKWWERLAPRLPAWTRLPSLPKPVESGPLKTRSHQSRTWVELPPGGWQAYPLSVTTPGAPHLLEVEYPSDFEQTLQISLVEPSATGQVGPLGLDSGVDVPAPQPGHVPQLQRHKLTCWPKTKTPYVLLVNRRSDRPALVGRINLLAGPRELPAVQIPQPNFATRTLAAYYDKPLFTENVSATEAVDPVNRRQLDDWTTFYDGGQRLVQLLQHGGYNALVLTVACNGSAIYPSRLLEPTPKYDTGGFFESGQDAVRKDVLELLMRLCDRSGIQLIPAVQFAGPLPQLEKVRLAGGPPATGLEPLGPDGRTWLMRRGSGGSGVYYNALDLRVQQAMQDVVGEIADRYGHHACFGGVAVQLGSESYSVLPDETCSYDDATIARFLNETQTEMPADALPQLAGRYKFLHEAGSGPWLQWRCEQLTKMYAQMQGDVARRQRGARLYLTTADLLAGPQSQRALRPTLPPRTDPSRLWPQLGLDVAALLKEDIVVPRPERIVSAADPEARLLAQHWNNWPALDESFGQANAAGKQIRGTALAAFEPASLRLPGFDAVSPFGAAQTHTLFLATISPANALARERFVRTLATLDTPLFLDGGCLLPLGQEAAVLPLVKVFRRLPAEPFATAAPASATDRPPELIVRTLATVKGDRTYFYVLNTSPWPVKAQLELTGPPTLALVNYADERPAEFKNAGGRATWKIALEPFDLVGGELSSGDAKVTAWRVERPEGIADGLREQIRSSVLRSNSLRNPPPLAVANASFEAAAAGEAIPGWVSARGPTMRVHVDRTQGSASAASLHLVNQAATPPVWIRSEPFEPPTTGRVWLSAAIRVADPARQPVLRLAVEARQGQEVYYRFGTVGQGERPQDRLTAQWNRYQVSVLDVPLTDLTEMRVGFDLMSPGEVWIDDVQVYGLYFDDRERGELLRSGGVASTQLDAGDLLESHRFVHSYWPSFLRRHVAVPEAPRPPAGALTGAPPSPPVPTAPTASGAAPRAAQNKKTWWDWVPWR